MVWWLQEREKPNEEDVQLYAICSRSEWKLSVVWRQESENKIKIQVTAKKILLCTYLFLGSWKIVRKSKWCTRMKTRVFVDWLWADQLRRYGNRENNLEPIKNGHRSVHNIEVIELKKAWMKGIFLFTKVIFGSIQRWKKRKTQFGWHSLFHIFFSCFDLICFFIANSFVVAVVVFFSGFDYLLQSF